MIGRTGIRDLLYFTTPGDMIKNYSYITMVMAIHIYYDDVLYNWYFLQAFNFSYFPAPHARAKITPFK